MSNQKFMKKLTEHQKAYIKIALEMVMNLNNEGKQVWLEFSPHVAKVKVNYFQAEDDLVCKDFDFDEVWTIGNYIFSISDKIYNNY